MCNKESFVASAINEAKLKYLSLKLTGHEFCLVCNLLNKVRAAFRLLLFKCHWACVIVSSVVIQLSSILSLSTAVKYDFAALSWFSSVYNSAGLSKYD